MNVELQTAKDLALRSGEMLLKYYAGEPSVEWKGKNDPVTTADRAVSRFIVDALRRHFPNDAILSEEEKDDLDRMTKTRVWVIDPMDGTKEFIARNGEFSVMIGRSEERRVGKECRAQCSGVQPKIVPISTASRSCR